MDVWFWALNLGVPLLLLAIGGIGIWIDSEHEKDLEYRRAQVGHVLITDLRSLPGREESANSPIALITGEVVLSANRLITLFGKIKQLFGGEVKSFHGVITRARQEATLRLMELAAAQGFDAVGNVRIEAVDIAGVTVNAQRSKKQGLYVGVIAYGTAYRRKPGVFPPPAPPTLEAYPN